uniref:Uncharacterized protein n=1 Tax=Oryza punctata TaxID=4537 RepID=A0A0E0ME32_ORYPU
MEHKPSGGKGRTSSASSVASPSAVSEGGSSSIRDIEQQKPVVAVDASSLVCSSEQHSPAEAEDGTTSANGFMQQKPTVVWNGFVRCMDSAARSEVMNQCLQKFDIHLDGCHPLPTRNPRKRCAWCSVRDTRTACNMNFRSSETPRRSNNGCDHVSKENI